MKLAFSSVGVFQIVLLLFGLCAVAQEDRPTDEWLTRPVDDQTFRTYLEFFSYDQQLSFDTRVAQVTEDEGITIEQLSFQSTPGVRVTARLAQPADGRVEMGGVVILHGGVPRGKDSPAVTAFLKLLAHAGWSALAIDMQHFGERSTDLLQTFTEKEKHERLYNRPSVYLAWVTQTAKDVKRAIDFLVLERSVDPARVVLLGFSRGAQVGAIVGGAERRLAAVVLIHGGHFDKSENGHLPAACPANYIGRITPRPFLMINGNHDQDYFKESSVLPLQRLAGEPKHIRWTDTGHGVVTEEDKKVMVRWLQQHFQ